MDKNRFLSILKTLYDDDTTAIDYNLSDQFNAALRKGVENKWITPEEQFQYSKGLNQKRVKLYQKPVEGPDGSVPTKKITRADGTVVTRPITLVDLLEARKSPDGGSFNGYVLPQNSLVQTEGVVSREELAKKSVPVSASNLGKREALIQEAKAGQLAAQQEEAKLGVSSNNGIRDFQLGLGGVLGAVRGVGAPIESLIRKYGFGQSREQILQEQFGRGGADLNNPLAFGADEAKYIGQKTTESALPYLAGLAGSAFGGVAGGALGFGLPGGIAGGVAGAMIAGGAARSAQDALVNAIMGTRKTKDAEGKDITLGFTDEAAGLQKEISQISPYSEFVTELIPNALGGSPKLPSFLNPKAYAQAIKAGTAGARAAQTAENFGATVGGGLLQRGYAAGLAKLPKLAAANQAIATSKVGRSIKGWNAGINQLAATEGAAGQELGEELGEFATEIVQGLFDRQQLIRENENRRAQGKEEVEVPGYFELIRDSVLGASFEGENRLGSKAFGLGSLAGQKLLGGADFASRKLTGQSLNPYVTGVADATRTVNPITAAPTATTGTPATPGAAAVSTAEAADMFRGFTAASGEKVIPIGSGQFGVVNAEGRIARVVEASEIDPSVFTPRGSTTTSGTTEAHVGNAGLLLSRSGLRGAEFKPVGDEKETVVGTTADGYAIRRTVDGDKVDVRVVSPDVLKPENQTLAKAHMDASGITPTTTTGFTAADSYSEEHTLNRAMLGDGTPAANSFDAAFDTDIAIDSGFTVRGRIVGKAKFRGREVNTHYVAQIPSGNGQVDTVVIPAQNIISRGKKINIHPVMNAGDTHDVLKYSQLTADDVTHDPAKMNTGKFTDSALGDGISPVMLTAEQAEQSRAGREAIATGADALRASGKDESVVNRSSAQRRGRLRTNVRGTIATSDTAYNRGDYVEHTDYKGETAAGVVVSNTPHGPLIAPVDGSPAYVAQASTITYTQSESGATATPTPEEAAAAAIAETMPESTAGGGAEDEEAVPTATDEADAERTKRVIRAWESKTLQEKYDALNQIVAFLKDELNSPSFSNTVLDGDWDSSEFAERTGLTVDDVDALEMVLEKSGYITISNDGVYDYSKIPSLPVFAPEEPAEPEITETLPLSFTEEAGTRETGPQEGRETSRSRGEEEARKARPAEEQEEWNITQQLKDVTVTENESEAVAEFSAMIGGSWQEIQALKPRNVEELEAALEKFLTGSKKKDGTVISAEDAKKAAKFIAELYDRMIFAQANRELQMAQDVIEGRSNTPSSRTDRAGKRIYTEHGSSEVEMLSNLAADIDAETRLITEGKSGWKDLSNSRSDKDIAARVMRKLRMQVMRKYYAENVPVIGVLDSVEELNKSFNAIFAKGIAAGRPSLQILLGFADRNVSSAVHEIAHALLENMPLSMQKDVLASLGFTPREPTPSNPSIIPLEAHEKWATSFEAQIMNAGSTNKRGQVVRLSSDRTTEQQRQMAEINDILEGLSPYIQEAYNVVFDNTGPRRPRSLVWELGYEGNEHRIFLWDNMPLVINHNGAEVLAKIPLAPMPQRLFHHTGPGLLAKGSTKQFEVVITQEGHPDFGKTFTITNGKILSIGGATNGFNTRLATSFAYWLSAINGGRSRDYKGLGKYERYGRDEPGYARISDADRAAMASMGVTADGTGTSVPSPFVELKASDPKVKKFLTELGLDDLTQADLDEIKALGLREDAEYWSKRYGNETGDWKERLADSIIDLRGMAIARKLLRGRGAVAEGYLRLTNGRYHPKLSEFADAIADVIRTSRWNIRAAEKVNDDGQLANVKNYELINADLASGQVIIKGPASDPKTFRVDFNTGQVFIAQGVVQDGPQKGQIQWGAIKVPSLPAGFKKWTSPQTRAEVGQRGVTAQARMNALAQEMGAKTPPQPVNYYYQIARILVSLDKNVVVSHPATVFFQQSGGRALRETAGMPLAQASQRKRNKAVGKPLADVGLLNITPDVVDAIRNQKHNEHVMRRIDTSQIYNVRPSDLPNSHAERSALIINRETQRILEAKDKILSELRQAEYKRNGKGAELKPYVYRVFDTASYIDPETNAPALKYERTADGEIVTDEDGNRVALLDEAGEPILDKKYIERFIVSYGRITPKTENAVLDVSKEELVKGDGSPVPDKMTATERAFKMAGRIVFYDPIDVQPDGSSSREAVDRAVNHMISEFNGLALRAMEKYTPIVNWNRAESGMQVWSPMTPVMKVEVKRVSGVDVLLPSLGAPKQAYNFDAVGATNRWNAAQVTRLPKEFDRTPESLIDAVDSNDKHYYMVTNDGGEFKYSIAVTNVETKAISIVESDKTYASDKDAVNAAQTEYESLRGQAYLVWHQIGAKRIADDILRIAELSQKSEKGLSDQELAEVHNAKVIMRQYDWYRGVSREIMKRYGKAGIMMADLVGATSPQTPVDSNWVNAGQILQNMMRPVYERIVRDSGGAKVAYRLPFSSERSITVYGLWRQLSYEANKMRDTLQVREKKPLVWDSKFVVSGKPNVTAIQNATDAELIKFLGAIAPKLETKVQDSMKRRQLESVVQSFIESVYWKREQGGSDPVASYVGWADRTQDWLPVSGMKYEVVQSETITTPIENEFMPLQRTVVPRNAISGAKFGANTDNVMQALYNSWLDIDEGVAAKARNFSLNLVSLSSGATIDVWAARYIRRAYHDWHQGTPNFDNLSDAEKAFFARIPPIAEAGVEGGYAAKTFKEVSFRDGKVVVEPPKYTIPNPADPRTTGEFGTGQAVMQMATEMINSATGGKLDMLPSDLQAVLWFTEKEVWSNAGWTNSSGAGGSFEYQMMQDIIRFGGFDRWTTQLSGNGVAHLSPEQKEVTLRLLNRMVYKGYGGDSIPVGYSSFLLSNTSGDQLSIDGRAQLDGMVIGYKGNTPLEPYNPETDLHLVVLNQPEKSLLNAINGVGNSSIVVNDPDIGAYVGKRVAIGIPNEKGASIIASVVPDRLVANSNGTYTVVLRAPNQLTDSTAVVQPKPVMVDAKKVNFQTSQTGEYSTALLSTDSLAKTHINGKSATSLFPARQPTGKHRSVVPVAPFDPFRVYESIARYVQMSGSLDGVISRNIGDLNADTDFDPMSNARAGFEWSFAPALANQRIVGDPQQVRYYQQFSELINRLQSHFHDNGEYLQMVVQNDPRNVSEEVTGIQGFVGIHGVWTPETAMRYADYGVDAVGPLSDLQKNNIAKLLDYQSGNAERIRQHEQRWLSVLTDFMTRPDIKDIVTNDVKLIQAHMSMFDVSVIHREDVKDAGIGDIAELFQNDAARQSISRKLSAAIESLGIVPDGDRVIASANTQAGTFDEATVRQVEDDIQRESTVGLGLYQRKRRKPVTQGDTFHVHYTSYAGSRIGGLDELFQFGMDAFQNNNPEGVERAWKQLTKIAADEVDRTFGEIDGVRITSNEGIGIFDGWIEPSVDTTIIIPETATIDEVLARSAHVGLLFHQSNVFVTQWGESKSEKVGDKPANGDYSVERGVVVTLNKPMEFADVKQMQEDGTLGATLSEDGKTLTGFTVLSSYDEGKTHEQRVKAFEDGINKLIEFLATRGIKAKAKFQNIRFWNLGAEENGTWGTDVREYREVLGDIEARNPEAFTKAINERVDTEWSKRVRSHVQDVLRIVHSDKSFTLPTTVSFEQTKLLPEMYQAIARNYEALSHNAAVGKDADPVVVKAYMELKKSLLTQSRWLTTRIDLVEGNPYQNRWASSQDILLNNRVKIQSDYDISPLHPLSDFMWDGKSLDDDGNPKYVTDANGKPMRYYDMMRAMYTVIADGLYNNSANQMGPDVAFAAYGLFFNNPYAFWAAATEIRARDIAANYGSAVRNIDGSLMDAETFAESWKAVPQKAGLLPIETMGSGIRVIDDLIDKLRTTLSVEHPGYNGTVPDETFVPVNQMLWKEFGGRTSGLIGNALAQRKRQAIKITDRVNVPAGNLVVLDADGSINADVIRDVIAGEPNLDGNIKNEGPIDRLVSALCGNVQHMNFPHTVNPFDVITDIYVKTNTRYYKTNEIPRADFVKFSFTLWATATDRQNEINYLQPIANMALPQSVKKTDDGRLLVYHTTLAGQHIGETGELLSSDDVLHLTGKGKSGLGGTPNRISYTYDFIYANHVAKMLANMAAMPNISHPWKKMERALHNVIEASLVDGDTDVFSNHIRETFSNYVNDNLSMNINDAIDVIKNDGVDTLLRMIDNEVGGDMDVEKIDVAKGTGIIRNWMELGDLHDGLEAYNRIFGTPYAMLTQSALNSIMKSATPTKDINVVTYEYAIDPNMLTEHVISEQELRTYSTINVEPTGRIFDRTGEVIKTIPEGDITRQGLTNGHLLAQRNVNYRTQQPDFVASLDTSKASIVLTSNQVLNELSAPLHNAMMELTGTDSERKAFEFIEGRTFSPATLRAAADYATTSANPPKWVYSAGVKNKKVDNSLVYERSYFGIPHVGKRMQKNRAVRYIVEKNGTSIMQTMTLDNNGYASVENHVIPTRELIRNTEWMKDAGMPQTHKIVSDAIASMSGGASMAQTDFYLYSSDEFADHEIMFFSMLLQGASVKEFDQYSKEITNAVSGHTHSQAILTHIYQFTDYLIDEVVNEVYGQNVVQGAQNAVSNILDDYIEDGTAGFETQLGLDKQIVNGIPSWNDVGTNPKSVVLHSYQHLDDDMNMEEKYYLSIKNGPSPFDQQRVHAYELTEVQYNLVRHALNSVNDFHTIDDMPGNLTIGGKYYNGDEQRSYSVSRDEDRLKSILDIFNEMDPDVLNGALEISEQSQAYLGTTDIVSNVGFQVFNDGGYITNHALVALLKAEQSGNRPYLVRKRFANSLGEQLAYDNRLYDKVVQKSLVTPAYLNSLFARIAMLGAQHNIAPTTIKTVSDWVRTKVASPVSNMPRLSQSGIKDYVDGRRSSAYSDITIKQNTLERGPNGGVLIWHGTLYGQQIGKNGALLSADDLESQGVISVGGGGSSDVISTTWNKQYAFDVARSNFNLTHTRHSSDLARDYFQGMFNLVQRINQAERGERETDPRSAVFLDKLQYLARKEEMAYPIVFPIKVPASTTSQEVQDAIIKDVLSSSSVEDLAGKLYFLLKGTSSYDIKRGISNKPTNAISVLDVGMNSLPENNKFRNVKGWQELQNLIAKIEALPFANEALNVPTDAADRIQWEIKQRPNVYYDMVFPMLDLINQQNRATWGILRSHEVDIEAWMNKFNALRDSLKGQGGFLNVRANKALHDLLDVMFRDYGQGSQVVQGDAIDTPFDAWKLDLDGLNDETLKEIKSANPTRGAESFHRAQSSLRQNLGGAYFLAIEPDALTEKDSYDQTPVVYEYEVDEDFKPQDYNAMEFELRTRGTVNMVPTGRIYDVEGNNIAPLLVNGKDISDVLNHPNTFVAQRRRRAVQKMNPKGWSKVQNERRLQLANEVMEQQGIPKRPTLTIETVGKPLASMKRGRYSRSGTVPAPIQGPPAPPRTPAKQPSKLWTFLVNAYDFMNDVGRMPLSGDMSPLTIQNWLLANPIEDPKLFFGQLMIGVKAAAPNMGFHYKGKTITNGKMMGREAFHALGNDLRNNPMYKWADAAGLRLTTLDVDRQLAKLRVTNPSATLMDINELEIGTDVSMSSELLQHGAFVGASNRFFAMSKDYVKFTKFANTCQHLIDIGYVPGTPGWEESIKDFASVYNVAQGDISFGYDPEKDERLQRIGKRLWFAPRWALSRAMLDPIGYGLLSITPQGKKLIQANRMTGYLWNSKRDPRATAALLRMLAKTWALWIALKASYEFIYRGFGYGSSETTKGGQRLRVAETILAPPGGIDKVASMVFAAMDAMNSKAYETPEDRMKAVQDALKAQLLGNIAPGGSMGIELLFGRDLMGKPSREVYTPLQTYWNTAVRPKLNDAGVDIPMPKFSNFVAERIINLAGQDFLESYESLYERQKPAPGIRATAYGLASTTGLRARYAPKATNWKRKADEKAPAPGLANVIIGKDRDYGPYSR